MSDERRVYSDQEFALILRTAAELAGRAEQPGLSSGGLTLTEMKSAAAQAGLDPALVERAARMMVARTTATTFERLIGGPLRHEHETRMSVELDEHSAARLLSGIRISAGVAGKQDVGHSGPMGMTWHDGGDTETLRVAARPDANGMTVSVVLDRRGTLGLLALASGITMFMAVLFAGFALHPAAPALGYAGFIVGIGGVLAGARAYWASSTRKARERVSAVVDSIGQIMTPERKSLPPEGSSDAIQ